MLETDLYGICSAGKQYILLFFVVQMALPKCECTGHCLVFIFFYKIVLYNVLKQICIQDYNKDYFIILHGIIIY